MQAIAVTSSGWQTWRAAMADALYGPGGFYRRPGAPRSAFRTSPHVSERFAVALARLAREVGAGVVYDVGAGGGELLAALHACDPGLGLVGVEVAGRPPGLPASADWLDALPDELAGLVVANEWLDNVAVDVVERAADGSRLVEVDANGAERAGPAVPDVDARWLEHWWPLTGEGDRAEVGRTRDDAWADVLRRLTRGVAVAIDYGADPATSPAGTLTGYREGRQVLPVPDGGCDITAHVLFAAVAAAGEAAGAEWTTVATQRDALRALGVSAARPAYEQARADPAGYLRALSQAGEVAELVDPGGLGAFTWLVQGRGVPPWRP